MRMQRATEGTPRRCCGVVLAGGRSSRMGCDKAMLDWQGRPLLEQQCERLRAAGVERVLVSGERPAHAGIADPLPGRGPLGGLVGIAAALGDEEVDLVVLPVDMPRLSPALLARLRDEQPQARALRPTGHVLPMRLRLDAGSRLRLLERLAAERPAERSLRALQEGEGCAELALAPAEVAELLDCNEPQQWQEALG